MDPLERERMQRIGQLELAKRDRDMAETESLALIDSLRETLDPLADFHDLELDTAQVLLGRLIELQKTVRERQELIDRLEKALYGKKG